MGLDWTLPRLPVSLPAKPVPYVNDLAVLKDRFAKALLNLNEHDFAPRAVWRDLFTLVRRHVTLRKMTVQPSLTLPLDRDQ